MKLLKITGTIFGVAGVLLAHKPEFTWPGLALVLTGVPVYFAWRRCGSGMTRVQSN